MKKLTSYLNQLIVGNVFDAPEILETYSTDRSILKITPKLVALPESTEDLQKLLRFFTQLAEKKIKIPLAIRGTGLDKMGSDLSPGLIISTEKLNQLLEINHREKLVRVQAGITIKELNTALSVSGLTLPIKAPKNATIGGLISGQPIDNYAQKYGGIIQYVEHLEVILSSGDRFQPRRINKRHCLKSSALKNPPSQEHYIGTKLSQLTTQKAPLIARLKKSPTHFTGYATIAHADSPKFLDIMPLFFGAEGSLGIISEVILRAVPLKKRPLRAIVTFPTLKPTLNFLDLIKPLRPLELNLYDLSIFQPAKNHKNLSKITKNLNFGFAIFMCFDEKTKSKERKLLSFNKTLAKSTQIILEHQDNSTLFDEFENAITSFLHHQSSGDRPPLLVDFSLPLSHLPDFIKNLPLLEKKLDLKLPFFGSPVTNIYHLYPQFNLKDPKQKTLILNFLNLGAKLIESCHGHLTGGGPEGRIKAFLTNKNLDATTKDFYTEIKSLFDPQNILGPDIKLDANPRHTINHFRTSTPSKIVL